MGWADDPELVATFRAEVEDRLASLCDGLLRLEKHPSPRQLVTGLFRDAHTVKGSARMLGLANKGHLGPGADADVTIYAPDVDKERMFSLPRYLIKGGEVVLDDGDLRRWPEGRTLHVAPEVDPAVDPEIAGWFEQSSSIAFANYPVRDEEVANGSVVACEPGGPP